MGNRIAFIFEVPQACSNAIGAAGSFYYYARVAKLKFMFYMNHMADMLCFRRILRFLQKSLRILQTSYNSEKNLRILQTSLRTFAEISETFTEISKFQKILKGICRNLKLPKKQTFSFLQKSQNSKKVINGICRNLEILQTSLRAFAEISEFCKRP